MAGPTPEICTAWRWNPCGCALPILDPTRFLGLMRTKSWAFNLLVIRYHRTLHCHCSASCLLYILHISQIIRCSNSVFLLNYSNACRSYFICMHAGGKTCGDLQQQGSQVAEMWVSFAQRHPFSYLVAFSFKGSHASSETLMVSQNLKYN